MSEFLDIISTTCDAIGCEEQGIYAKEVTVLDMLNEPFTFAAFFCEEHKADAHTAWDGRIVVSNELEPKRIGKP